MSLSLRISRNDFLAALSSLQNVTGKKGTIAILSNVLITTGNNSINITGTDLEVGIRIRVEAEILSEGSITLPSKKLFEIVRESDSKTITLELQKNNWVKITADSTDYNLAGMEADEYPAFPEYHEDSLVEIDAEIIKDLIDKTIFSVAQEGESQFNLTGVLFEKIKKEDEKIYLRMISSDGHRLSFMENEVSDNIDKIEYENSILIPKKGVNEIRKFCEGKDFIAMGFEKNQAVIKNDSSLMIIRLMNGDFPDYKNIIDVVNEDKFYVVKKENMINSMKRMNLFTEDRFNAVKFYIESGHLTLSSESMDIGNAKDEIKIDYEGEVLTLGFNGRYFVDVLHVMSSDNIKVFINSDESPCLIKGDEDPGFLSVIMPMKI